MFVLSKNDHFIHFYRSSICYETRFRSLLVLNKLIVIFIDIFYSIKNYTSVNPT